MPFIYSISLCVLLVFDLYIRMKEFKQGYRYLLTHWYEIPALIPLYAYTLLEADTIFGAWTRALRLVPIFRFMHMLSRTIIIFDEISNRLTYIRSLA